MIGNVVSTYCLNPTRVLDIANVTCKVPPYSPLKINEFIQSFLKRYNTLFWYEQHHMYISFQTEPWLSFEMSHNKVSSLNLFHYLNVWPCERWTWRDKYSHFRFSYPRRSGFLYRINTEVWRDLENNFHVVHNSLSWLAVQTAKIYDMINR